jgi:hypothetical protein
MPLITPSGYYLPPVLAQQWTDVPEDTSTPSEWFPNGVPTVTTDAKTLSFAIVALVLLVLAALFFCVGRKRQKRTAESQKSSIFAYLQQFDVEDIDLRKSPPGGWHGTYLNKLAYGINKADSGDYRLPDVEPRSPSNYESAPLNTHSSVARDSLFMDTASTPSLGYHDDPNDSGLDSYDDLRPRTYEDKTSNLQGKEVI